MPNTKLAQLSSPVVSSHSVVPCHGQQSQKRCLVYSSTLNLTKSFSKITMTIKQRRNSPTSLVAQILFIQIENETAIAKHINIAMKRQLLRMLRTIVVLE